MPLSIIKNHINILQLTKKQLYFIKKFKFKMNKQPIYLHSVGNSPVNMAH